MKLRNKKTGEIDDYIFEVITDRIDLYRRVGHSDTKNIWHYNSLAEFNEEWEDYEDELYYIISAELKDGYICALKEDYKKLCETAKELGIGFETEKEAEKAVEKLKAWKRLKDKGFRFDGIAGITNEIYFEAKEPFTHIMVDEYMADETEKEYIDDLILLFGGEE